MFNLKKIKMAKGSGSIRGSKSGNSGSLPSRFSLPSELSVDSKGNVTYTPRQLSALQQMQSEYNTVSQRLESAKENAKYEQERANYFIAQAKRNPGNDSYYNWQIEEYQKSAKGYQDEVKSLSKERRKLYNKIQKSLK